MLRFTEPGGVTVPGKAAAQDPAERERVHAVLDADSDGRPRLPGTSLAGALREMVRGQRDEDVAGSWFGRLPPPGSGAEVDAVASQVWVLGSRLLDGDGDVPVRTRVSTRISRFRGAAESSTLRSEQVLPAGTRFEVFLRWDDAPRDDLEELVGLLAAWRPLIGRGVSRGRGRCEVEAVRHGTLRLDDPDDLLRWLTSGGPDLARAVARRDAGAGSPAAGTGPVLRVTMRIAGPWRTGSGETPPVVTGGKREHTILPLFRVDGDYVIPGTALKGLLRSRAEYILRSVRLAPGPCDDQRCEACWSCEVFGSGGGTNPASDAVGVRSAVRVADAAISGPVRVSRTHVAIDRFTGGALDEHLYEVEALEEGSFTVTVDHLAEIADGRLAEIQAVLRLVLEDLDDGLIGMGGGTARGYGSVAVDLAGGAGGLPTGAEARRVLATMVRNSEHVSG